MFDIDTTRGKTSEAKPLKIFKKYKTLEAVSELGTQVQGFLNEAVGNPLTPVQLDHGRIFLTVQLEVTIHEDELPPPQDTFNITQEVE